MKKRVIFILSCLLLSMGFITAQTTQITGIVVEENGEPVIGASVVVKGTTTGTITDVDGHFSLGVPADKKTLVFSLVGMKSVEQQAAPGMRVVMREDSQVLEEIVVTGYGVTKKTAFTGSATVIDSKKITARTDADFTKSLQGSVTGLNMTGSSSAPGAMGAITIRGVGSYNASTSPLFIVDGTPLIAEEMAMSASNKQIFSPMANINPADIENITVLKDAAATAIYGSRAANGVIVITTKNGSSDKLSINLRLKKGFTKMAPVKNDYKLLNDEEWLDAWAKGILNSDKYEDGANKQNYSYNDAYQLALNEATNTYGYRGFDTDWVDAVTRTGNVDEYSIDFSGKSGNTSYFASGGYFRNEGVIINTGVERYTGRFNLSTKYKFITFGVNMSGASSTSKGSPTSTAYANPLVAVYGAVNPVTPIYNEDGTYNLDAYYNPVALNDVGRGDIRRQKFTSLNVNPYVSLDLSNGFYWKTSLGYSMIDMNEYQFWSLLSPQGVQYNGLGQKYNETRKNITITNTLNWLHTFNNVHNVNILLGQEAIKNSYYHEYYAASNFALEGYRDMISAAEYQGAEDLRKEKRLNSFFMNAEYDYMNKYYASASLRRDGASTFGVDNRWGTFWSIGGKWRISEEPFMENVNKYLSNLALRTSYGSVGNSETTDWYAAKGFYKFGYNYNSQPGMRPMSVDNRDLGWEGKYKFDVGFDALLFDRVNITFDYFDERTKDMLFSVPVSMTTGLKDYMKNIGEMKNSGIELGINANVFQNRDWNITLYANMTASKNKMTKTPNGEDVVPSTVTITQVNRSNYAVIRQGYSFNSFYLREWAGVDPETGKPLWYKKDGTTTSVYNEAERRIVGNADPNIYGGFGLNVAYKGFDLGADFTYSQGNKVYGDGLRFDLQVGNDKYGNVTRYVYENAWTPENRYTNVPEFIFGDTSGANNHSSRFLMDGSYLRLQTLTFGYTIPKYLTNKWYLNNIRLYASVENLFTITADDYIGFDPAVTQRGGGQSWVYPTSRTFMFGLNIGF